MSKEAPDTCLKEWIGEKASQRIYDHLRHMEHEELHQLIRDLKTIYRYFQEQEVNTFLSK